MLVNKLVHRIQNPTTDLTVPMLAQDIVQAIQSLDLGSDFKVLKFVKSQKLINTGMDRLQMNYNNPACFWFLLLPLPLLKWKMTKRTRKESIIRGKLAAGLEQVKIKHISQSSRSQLISQHLVCNYLDYMLTFNYLLKQ